MLNGLIAGGTGRKEGIQACYFSAAHPQTSKAEQKSHRTHWQFNKILGHRLTSCLTQIKKQKMLDLKRNCVNSILRTPHREELEASLPQFQVKCTEVNTRTAELCSKRGNIDLSELMVIDDLIQCKACKRPVAQGKSFSAHVDYQQTSQTRCQIQQRMS